MASPFSPTPIPEPANPPPLPLPQPSPEPSPKLVVPGDMSNAWLDAALSFNLLRITQHAVWLLTSHGVDALAIAGRWHRDGVALAEARTA